MNCKCFVSNKLKEKERDKIRLSVCRDLLANLKHDGEYYCILHFPSNQKDEKFFEEVFWAKLDINKRKLEEIKTYPEIIQERQKSNLILDFRYVWFPSKIDRLEYDFETTVLFGNSTFCEEVSFWGDFNKMVSFSYVLFCKKAEFGSKFFQDTSFDNTIFTTSAVFAGAEFLENVSFDKAKFLNQGEFKFYDTANFNNAKFSKSAHFEKVLFESKVDFNSATFCEIAYFREAKFLQNALFFRAIFLDKTSFTLSTFSDETNFREAEFKDSVYFEHSVIGKKIDFSGVRFEGFTDFRLAVFMDDVLFELAQFHDEVNFRSTTFRKGAYFHRIRILDNSKLSFIWTSFQELVKFNEAIIKGYLHFEAGDGDIFDGKWSSPLVGNKSPEIVKRFTPVFEGKVEFHHIGAEKPERITFNKVRLRPSWFVNADSRKINFTDISWEKSRGKEFELRRELNELKDRLYSEPHNYKLLTISLRNLAANAEEFNRFEEASNFRKSAFECERLERKAKGTWDFVHRLYYELSEYGESCFRAFYWLVLIWIYFALAYWLFGKFQNNESIEFLYSFGYSLQVMTLQKPEPRPSGWVTVLYYGLQTILAPLQAALLALAIRRKFMR